MLQWAPKIDPYLEAMYARSAITNNPLCSKCGKGEAIWRCGSCIASPLFCAACCQSEHESRPFHRIEMWTGTCFEPSWLWKVGVCLHSGHGGSPCPKSKQNPFKAPSVEEYQRLARSSTDNMIDLTFGASPNHGTLGHTKEVVVVHTNGIHEMLLHTCECEDRKSDDIQVLEIGLYPATFTSISTVFTFDVLDDYLLSAMECNTTAQQYYGKLRRRTNGNFPDSVKVFESYPSVGTLLIRLQDQYRELLRVGRQYDFHCLLMRFLAQTRLDALNEGSLALFCAACPQPGKNLPSDWPNDPERCVLWSRWEESIQFVNRQLEILHVLCWRWKLCLRPSQSQRCRSGCVPEARPRVLRRAQGLQ
jgi:CxC2 like cysteine cluster associated with KDZ transposases